jgi:hypothetical protein
MSWIRNRSPQESLKILGGLAEICSQLGGPYAKEIYSLFANGHYLDVINYKIDYSIQWDTDDLFYTRQIQSLVSKQDFIDLGIDKEQVAYAKFLIAEEKCRETNDRFFNGPSPIGDVAVVLHYAQRKIDSILGPVPNLCDLDFSFGPGATTSTKKSRSHPLVKLGDSPTCSLELARSAGEFLNEIPHWSHIHRNPEGFFKVKMTPSKLIFVPKDSRTLRSIGVEPSLNGFFQKGVGTYLKKRLYKAGVNLYDQSRNQEMAKQASVSGAFCTVDLASASDTISYAVVQNLLPTPWFDLLDKLRSGVVSYKGKTIELEKFSSMGNSYTFELESLIFYSICYGVCKSLMTDPSEIGVYGDDLIIRTSHYSLLDKVLEYCGFSVNSEKSFTSGLFRESCGADFYNGTAVRPFYQKTLISDRTLFVMHNWFIRNGEPRLAEYARQCIKPHNLLFGPDGYGDGHLIGSYRLRQNRRIKRAGYEGGFFDSFTLNPRRFRRMPEVTYVYPLYCIYVSDPETEMDHTVLPGTRGYSRISIYTMDRTVFRRPCGG